MTRFGALGAPENTGPAWKRYNVWRMLHGEEILIRDMTDDHLDAALWMILRMESKARDEIAANAPLDDRAKRILILRDPRGPGLLAEWRRRNGDVEWPGRAAPTPYGGAA